MKRTKTRLIAAMMIAAVIVAISPQHASAEGRKCIPIDDRIAGYTPVDPPVAVRDDAVFLDKDGNEKTFADYRGTPLVVNFWATWCAPCIREMPSLDNLQGEISKEGIEVLTISEDRAGLPVVEKFFELRGYKHLPILVDKKRKVMRGLKVRGLPTTVFIDAQGNEVGRLQGPAEWDSGEMKALIRNCLLSSG